MRHLSLSQFAESLSNSSTPDPVLTVISNFSAALAFVCLAASIICLWVPRPPSAWAYLFAASMVFAAFSGVASAAGLCLLGAAMVCIHLLVRSDDSAAGRGLSPGHLALQILAVSVFSIIAIGIATGLMPGFEKLVLYRDVRFTPDAVPYTLTLNYGKAAVGVMILGLAGDATRTLARRSSLLPVISGVLITLITVSALSVMLAYTRIEPKWNSLFLPWAAVNLLFVCVAEEAFFRAFLQKRLSCWLAPMRRGQWIAWITASLLFGIAHAGGGAGMILLATVAGLGYGWVYMKNGRIEFAVLTHFLVNSVHFLLLTYPRLA